jgi:NADH pyrophosphatase NudC (nudix superfamily)
MDTLPTEGGTKRRCTNRQPHKQYPRTDPVVGHAGSSSSSASAATAYWGQVVVAATAAALLGYVCEVAVMAMAALVGQLL